jgi:phage terminase large subunit-like protein
MFPNGSHDDQVDGAARAFNGMVAPAVGIHT